jgi:hypothetical protein
LTLALSVNSSPWATLAFLIAAKQAVTACGQPNADMDIRTQHLKRRQHPISAHYRKVGIQMPEKSFPAGRWKRRWWRTLLGVVAAVALVMLVMNPELAALGFLFDPIVLDVAIMFLGTQLLLFNGHIRTFLIATYSSVIHGLKAIGRRR